MPGELPEGCDYSAWARLRDEWRLAGRIWRKRHSEPEREREIASQYGQHVAVHVLSSRGRSATSWTVWTPTERSSTTFDRRRTTRLEPLDR